MSDTPSPYLSVAKQISEYLTLGMHHSTAEAQRRMAELIERAEEEEDKKAWALWREQDFKS
jgi:ABC-type microcin C transport system duplicated ATPase subunit YejF